MKKTSSSKDLIVGGGTSEISTDVDASMNEVMRADASDGFAYRAAVLAARGTLQFIIMAVVLVGAAFLMNELQESRKERPKRAQKEAVYTIETVQAIPQAHQPKISTFGDVVAGRTLNITALVPGEVVEMNKALRVGGRVSKGDPLVVINKFGFEIARDEAKANLQEAKATLIEARARLLMEETGLKRSKEQLDLAEADLERAKRLVRSGTLTRRAVEERELVVSQRKAAFQSSGANIAIQKAQIGAREAVVQRLEVTIKNAEQELINTTLKAPFDAIVQAMNVEVGQTITTALSLITLFEADTLDARFVLSDAQYGRLINSGQRLEGRKIKVNWNVGVSQNSYEASIDRVGAQIAANRGGITVFARIEKNATNDGLRPGAFVEVDVPDQTFDKTFRLPETAIFEGNVAYIVGAENRLEARPVKIAVYDGAYVIVSGGLREGDDVLVTQIAEVGEGLLVRHAGEKSGKETVSQDKPSASSSTKPRS
ncbi:MAG: efflux RND transporter periplasmic adaptor subunit [Hyphomicrobiales bacterium]